MRGSRELDRFAQMLQRERPRREADGRARSQSCKRQPGGRVEDCARRHADPRGGCEAVGLCGRGDKGRPLLRRTVDGLGRPRRAARVKRADAWEPRRTSRRRSRRSLADGAMAQAVACACRAGQLCVVDDEDGDGVAARTCHPLNLRSQLRSAEDHLDARAVEHLSQPGLRFWLVERHKAMASPECAELACNHCQRIIECQADGRLSTGGTGDHARDSIRHLHELGVRHGAGKRCARIFVIYPHDSLRVCTVPKQRTARPWPLRRNAASGVVVHRESRNLITNLPLCTKVVIRSF